MLFYALIFSFFYRKRLGICKKEKWAMVGENDRKLFGTDHNTYICLAHRCIPAKIGNTFELDIANCHF